MSLYYRDNKITYWLAIAVVLGLAIFLDLGIFDNWRDNLKLIIAIVFFLLLGYLSFRDEENEKDRIKKRQSQDHGV